MQGGPVGRGDLISFGSAQSQTSRKWKSIECHANPNSYSMLQYICCFVDVTSWAWSWHALIPVQFNPGRCVSQTRGTWLKMSLFENKMRNKILVDHHDHHVRMAVADWEQTMINIDQPQFCFSSEHGWQNTIAIRAIHKVCGWPWPGLRTYRSRSRRTQRCGVPWSSAGKPWPLLLDVGWGSHFLEAMQCNTIYRII